MDVAALTAFLAPFVPYLLKGGRVVAEEAGKAFGAEAWQHAEALWKRLRPSVETKEAAQEAATDLAEKPDDARVRAAFELQLEKLLANDGELAAEITRLWSEASAAGVVVVTGDRAVGAGRDISGTVVTGDDVRIG